ncbi:fimbria/pilus periplasmic chaperone [Paraburkholderia sp. 22099]|jgi:chaperone protein EcpD|uniref:fimbria/pilus periplasmic chaperone n=1 Tax=Paraburkholderia TaxID=1822464 RepID=UPI002859FF16|nr:fimbria/pilus periplasmic chaperone [Paraburkholderia terricola]MDR6491717.1 chaperone protein EcpD [Paraburkholderia terricola]
MKRLIKTLTTATLLAASAFCVQANASVVVAATRVVFPANEREVTVKLSNDGNTPALVQAWIDTGDQNASPEQIKVPFTLTPSMFRLDPKKGQTLRMIYTKEPLAQDKESMFWLNVLEVPPKAGAGEDMNKLQLAFRTRIKVFFRPQGLQSSAQEAPSKAQWSIVRGADGKGYALQATNPTPYFVNLGSIALEAGGKTYDAGSGYLKPGSSELFPIANLTSAPSAAEVNYTSINDWGGGVKGKQAVSASN